MARVANRLTAKKVETTRMPARLADGLGLYLIVEGEFSKNWVFEYQLNGKRRYMGLGSALDVSLADAREKRDAYRKMKAAGVDPLDQKRAARAADDLTAAKAVTFKDAATRYIAANRAGWQNAGHALQWESTLETYAFPTIGHLSVQSVDTALVLQVIQPIWVTLTETATRVRGRIELVLDWAKALNLREGENPARWRGHLDKILPAPKKVRKKRRYPALPWKQMPAFVKDLRQVQQDAVGLNHPDGISKGIEASAMEFLILTVARKTEVIDAKWDEIDLQNAAWTVPAERMKMRVEHRVPLSKPAIAVLEQMQQKRINDFVFCATIRGTERISEAVFGRLIEAMNAKNVAAELPKWTDPKDGRVIVPHGFRSSFRDWAGESTGFAREVIEKALAHSVGDESERSYARGDLFEKRRKLMDAWATFVANDPSKTGDNVV
jgi:integrase